MRTTLTLDPDVARMVDEAMHRQRTTFKRVVNDAIRVGLSRARAPARKRYRVVPHSSALLPGYDPVGFNRLADELEDDAILARVKRSGS